MSAAQTPTERKVSDLQVGDALVLSYQGENPTMAALITGVEPLALGTQVRLTFLVQPAGEDEVHEVNYSVSSDYTVGVL